MSQVNFILQGKGGVGKTLVSSLLAQHKKDKNKNLICIDTDPVNATFFGYKNLNVSRLELMKNSSVIDESQFDNLIELIINSDNSDIIIDNGASSFIPLSSYLIENNVIPLLVEAGHDILIHSVITGGQALHDTLSGFNSTISQFPDAEKLKFYVWLNGYFGKIESEGKSFQDMKVFKNHAEKISGVINLNQQSNLFNLDMKLMLENKLTFDEALESKIFNFMQKNRIKLLKKEIFSELNRVFNYD